MGTTRTLTTADELFAMLDDGFRYELVKGELLRMAPAGGEHGTIGMHFGSLLDHFVRANRLGAVCTLRPSWRSFSKTFEEGASV